MFQNLFEIISKIIFFKISKGFLLKILYLKKKANSEMKDYDNFKSAFLFHFKNSISVTFHQTRSFYIIKFHFNVLYNG